MTNSWEQRKLGELSSINKGEQLGKKEMLDDGAYYVLNYVLNGGKDPSGFTNSFNTNENTISISEGGNSCGYVCYNTQKYWSGGHNYTLTSLKIESMYLYSYLKKNEEIIMSMRVGSGLPNIQKTSLLDYVIRYPSIEEQTKIGVFFEKIDALITLHQRE